MSGILSTIIMLLILGVLITVHEFGHFIAARICGIKVREFAIGMGPVLYRKDPAKAVDSSDNIGGTRFTLRALPIGGFCDMGEDEASDDPSHFRNKSIWQRFFVLAAGSAMNFITGLLILLIITLFLTGSYVRNTVISSLSDDFPYSDSIKVGDRIVRVNGRYILNYMDFETFIMMDTDKPYEFTLERNGELITVKDIERKVQGETGMVFGLFLANTDKLTLAGSFKYGALLTVDYVRLVWISLGELISGSAKPDQLIGPVGMGGVVNDIITEPKISTSNRIKGILDLAALIAVNLAAVNLLPIPALDGGRIIFLFISAFLVLVRKRPLSAKVEGYIHGITMIMLFALMIFVFFNDIRRLVNF